jgi:uncharacterized protein
MKGNKHPKNDTPLNTSGNGQIRDLLEAVNPQRRQFMKASLAASATLGAGACTFSSIGHASSVPSYPGFGGIGFHSIPADTTPVDDRINVPPGYVAEPIVCWGDPIMPGAPDWQEDASQNAQAQERQFGMHNDGMHFFPFPSVFGPSNERGLLCVNNEYTHEDILHGAEGLTGGAGVTIQKVRKSQAAHGVSIVEVRKVAGRWGVVRNSAYGRRITANTPVKISGPAAGHPWMRSKKFAITPQGSQEIGQPSDGFSGNGTINNCAHGYTPWGTYLTCEENWNGNFGWMPGQTPSTGDAAMDAKVRSGFTRYGVSAAGFGYQWHTQDARLNAATNPLETHHFGWVVEIDPFDPKSTPIKRTALGRFKHESAQMALSTDEQGRENRLAYYMGDDERNEYIYKFVAVRAFNPNNRAANRHLLDEGILYVAQFNDAPVAGKPQTYQGRWLPLVPDSLTRIENPSMPGTFLRLRDLPLFAAADDAGCQALILINTRQAADALGATMMDRPEWMALRTYAGATGQPYSASRPLEIYCTLTNNNRRGGGGTLSSNKADGTTAAGSARPPVDLANPRPDNDYGHIIRWRETGNHVTAVTFEWDIFLLAGDANTTKTLAANYLNTNLVDGVQGTGPYYQGQVIDNSPANNTSLGAPDGLWFDHFGRLWIQTDQAGDATGDWINIGTNVMCCVDPATKEVRRFLTSPRNCEVTGMTSTPDGKAFFVGIQHPGEDATAANPTEFSNWPQGQYSQNSAGQPLPNGPARRPRSSVLVITKLDGGVVGA